MTLSLLTPLLAQEDIPFLHIGDRFRVGNSSFSLTAVLLVVAVALSVGGVVWILKRWTQKRELVTYHSPRQLWRELCHEHKLGWSERRLLEYVAQRGKLAEPCELFIEPAHLAACLARPEFRRFAPQLAALHERLFKK